MTPLQEIKPCPFCGSEAKLIREKYAPEFAVQCQNWEAHVHNGIEVWGDTAAEAIDAWNRRSPAPAAVREAVAEKISGMRVLLTRIKTNIPDCDESCKCWQWQLHRDMAAMDSDLSHLRALAAAKMEGA